MLKRDFIRNIFGLLLIAGVFLGLRTFVFSTAKITEVESNTYLRTGDLVLINKKKELSLHDFVQYDVEGKTYIGRLIAEAGDSVVYMDDIFYRNNQAQDEPYLTSLKNQYVTNDMSPSFTDDFDLTTLTGQSLTNIPEGYYLILNDNRKNQADSRQFGLIKKSQIKGVVEFRLWPMDDFGFIRTE
ncbi:signal peptidase I [Streptococcus sp. sy010]|uniref:signal peptidase I n=1 Tax=Streptococcus sp. sy010 TaxID=2600148 RepID=UPI0011B65D13|nr:signal peptidase I [Streptococcus sp. sy010]TWT16539.1 signal peptidase I [Streptococcus sp. sy010]